MSAIKKTIILMILMTVLLAPTAASAQAAAKQSPLEAAYFAQINGLVSRNLEEILPKDQWPAEKMRLMILVQIKENGTIGHSELALKSEHEVINQALMAALEKSQPLPAPPEELQVESGFRLMGLVFNLDKNAPPQPEGDPAPPQGQALRPPAQASETAK